MFGKRTVFIIGAGTGADFNMPLGKGLKEKISEKLKTNDQIILHAMKELYGWESQWGMDQFNRAKEFIAANMPLAESIDNFLHTHSSDEKLVSLGKAAIAACILDAEQQTGLIKQPKNVIVLNKKEHWISRFCTIALTGILAEDAADAFKNVTVVTFNYDRCLEHYIVQHISAYLGLPEDKAAEIARSLNIIHVYGQVGRIEWQEGNLPHLSFGAKPSYTQLLEVSQQIRTFTERLEEDDTQKRIENALSEAELVVTSGFSFGSSNWEFLQNTKPGPGKKVIAGIYDMSEPNQENVRKKLYASLHPGKKLDVDMYTKGFVDLMYDYSTYFD